MNIRLSFYQILTLILLFEKFSGDIRIHLFVACTPLIPHYLIKLGQYSKMKKKFKGLPWWWWLE